MDDQLKERQAGDHYEYLPGSRANQEAIAEIIDKRIDLGMLAAGYDAYEEWIERDPAGEEIGDLIRSVYAAMQAQLEHQTEQTSQEAESPPDKCAA